MYILYYQKFSGIGTNKPSFLYCFQQSEWKKYRVSKSCSSIFQPQYLHIYATVFAHLIMTEFNTSTMNIKVTYIIQPQRTLRIVWTDSLSVFWDKYIKYSYRDVIDQILCIHMILYVCKWVYRNDTQLFLC